MSLLGPCHSHMEPGTVKQMQTKCTHILGTSTPNGCDRGSQEGHAYNQAKGSAALRACFTHTDGDAGEGVPNGVPGALHTHRTGH